jgi:hypothetical protein
MPASTPGPVQDSDTAGLPRLFVLIVFTEVLVLVALYWFGAHFS